MKRLLAILLVIAAAALLAAGLVFGNASAVWHQAAYVCLECMGIG